MTAILIFAAFAGAIMTIAGGYRAAVAEEIWETGGGTPYGCIVCVAGAAIFLGSIGALIGRAYL